MTFDKSTATLTATPQEVINLINSAKFKSRLNQDYNQAQIDLLTTKGTKLTFGQCDWLPNTRIRYLNNSPTPNQVTNITNRQPIKHLYLTN